MDLGLGEKGAVVLASSSGLGRAVAAALLAEGASVAISARDAERLERARAELARDHGDRVLAEPLDVTDLGALQRHLETARERFGAVDVLVTNAGGPPPGPALEVDVEGLRAAAAATLESAVHAIRVVLPWMRERRWGRILALTSLSVRQPIPNLAYSNVLRAGLTGYLKTLAGEVAADGVLVNSLCTGLFGTARLDELFAARARTGGTTPAEERARAESEIPLGRLGDPRELGELVAFLVSERCSYLNGVALPLDGGLSRGLL